MCRSVTGLRPIEIKYPFELVTLDTGHVTLPTGQKEYFLACVDFFPNWAGVRVVSLEMGVAVAGFPIGEMINAMNVLSFCSLTMGDCTWPSNADQVC